MTFDLFMIWSNLCPSCCGNTGRLLHGICKYAGERIVSHGLLVFPAYNILKWTYNSLRQIISFQKERTQTYFDRVITLKYVSIQQHVNLDITKTRLYNFDPLKPHFYIVKLGFTGVYIIFLISAQKHRLWVLVRTVSAKISKFLSENFQFLEVKFSIYLYRRVFVM